MNYAQSRDAKASSNLEAIEGVLKRAQELMLLANNGTNSQSDRDAIAAELRNIRTVTTELLNDTDFQGTPVFDNGVSTAVPVSRGINLQVVGTLAQVSQGIAVRGVSKSLDDILADALNSVTTGTPADRAAALEGVNRGFDHIVYQEAEQGIRADRLETAKSRLVDVDLTLIERRSALEDTDVASALASIQSKLTTLQAAQAVFARINQQSLFDLIR